MKKLFLLAFAAAAFASCSEKENTTPPRSSGIISFEQSEHLVDVNTGRDVVLGDVTMNLFTGEHTFRDVFCAKAYLDGADYDDYLFRTQDQVVRFGSFYESDWDAWGGFAVSRNADRTAVVGASTQQFSVWAAGGANGTSNFAVCYDMNTPAGGVEEYMSDFGYPTINFTKPCVVSHLYMANSTFVYNFFTGEDSDSYKVTISGSRGGVETGTQTVVLVDGASKVADWKKVDLSELGTIDKLVFKVVCDITKDPSYFCIDEIAFEESAAN